MNGSFPMKCESVAAAPSAMSIMMIDVHRDRLREVPIGTFAAVDGVHHDFMQQGEFQ
ncbi:hypothetical protein [Bradyrhizobium sp. RDM4]|uniref:hypothetical protein n=1 Tax=Bradyrhizobium sp. RDM4 TaxID=3378765 RepID=UPI0038FD0535